MSFFLSIMLIISGFSGISNPEKIVRSRSEALIKKGKPPIKEEHLQMHINSTKNLSIICLVGGIIIFLLDIVMLIN